MIQLSKPYIPEKAIEDAIAVIKSGNLVQGLYVKKFEEGLCNYLSVKNAVVVSNGTAALHLSLKALNIKEGDEVIVPAFTYPATANVVEMVGAKTVLVDINLDDFCINTDKIESAINSRTKAIMPVHEFGQSAKMDDIVAIAEKYNLLIIEDAACALGTEFKKKKVGTFGIAGCFSFHPRKAITTGEGGAIVTNDDTFAEKVRSLRNHGIRINENGKYDFLYAGFNYRMTDFQAALGLSQLNIIEEIIARRIEIASYYDRLFLDSKWLQIPIQFNDRRIVYQTYHLIVNEKIDRDLLISHLKKNGIETNFGAYAINVLTYYKNKYSFENSSMPNAVKAHKQGIALPISFDMEFSEASYIKDTINHLLK